jgi:hypothetical protein
LSNKLLLYSNNQIYSIMDAQETFSLQEQAFDLLRIYSDDCRSAAQDRIGLHTWFKAFLQSRQFTDFDNEQKGASFELYQNLMRVLEDLSRLDIPQA